MLIKHDSVSNRHQGKESIEYTINGAELFYDYMPLYKDSYVYIRYSARGGEGLTNNWYLIYPNQDIKDIGLVVYYDNPDYYKYSEEEQRILLIKELNSYDKDIKIDDGGTFVDNPHYGFNDYLILNNNMYLFLKNI